MFIVPVYSYYNVSLCGQDNQRVKISFYGGCVVQGEVLVRVKDCLRTYYNLVAMVTHHPLQLKCFHKKQTAGQEILFRVQFHTSAVVDHELVLNKEDLDAAYRGVWPGYARRGAMVVCYSY